MLDLIRKRPPTESAIRNQEMGISRAERRNERRPRVVAAFGEAIADPVVDLLELTELAWHDGYSEITPSEQAIDECYFAQAGTSSS